MTINAKASNIIYKDLMKQTKIIETESEKEKKSAYLQRPYIMSEWH